MAEFYKFHITDWNEGTANLTLEQEAAYLRIVNAIRLADGPITFNTFVLCGLWRCNDRKAKRILDELVDVGKIAVEAGKLVNRRAVEDASALNRLRADRASAGRRGGIESGKSRSNPLKMQEPRQASGSTREEKRREELKEREAKASPKNAKAGSLQAAVIEAAGGPEWSLDDLTECMTIWLALGLKPDEIIETARAAATHTTAPLPGPRALDPAMSAAATAKRQPKPKADPKGTRLSPDWQLPKPWGMWALEQGLTIPEVRQVAENFKDYWLSVPAKDGRKADWQATWRNRVRYVLANQTRGSRHGKPENAGLSEGGERLDPALDQITRIVRARHASGNGGAGAGGSGEEAGQVRLGS